VLGHESYREKKLAFSSIRFPRLKKVKINVQQLERVEIEVSMLPALQELEIYSHYTDKHHEHEVGNDKHVQKMRIVVDLKKENNAIIEENAATTGWWMDFC
jgi:gamma-glutamylcyclotransferase (GGCT)/AIG2-like uncharacterized protein YtfP